MMSKSMITVHTLYNFLWYLTHALISVVQLIHRHLYLKLKTKRVLSSDLRELANGLQKIPKHIAVCVNEHHVDCHQLIQLIRWCHVFNVKYVSLFSHYDTFVSLSQLEDQFVRCATNGHKATDDGAHNNGFAKTRVNGKTSGGVITMDGMSVCVVSSKHSRQSIVKAAQHLSRQKAPIDQNEITDYLRKTYDFPDPELLIAFGGSPAVYGYPLWQLRLTEIRRPALAISRCALIAAFGPTSGAAAAMAAPFV
ncbi:unnamed protein product [Oppiella nova]|uniref:ditrans,polycis-polyprenyl diphosphate synthase [(2E,6E)-farnesyldiphosphate specific] n=1 Tax=Oppiella nova TaxID=334625 RepID=A0A7R9QUX5_9ACAR|nr:unnamed protein product [Oppiella nova]CAG2174933.1 unnamed protein product [Oppiella nova]